MRSVALAVALVFAPALAGCFGDEPAPASYTLAASGGKVSPGWAYDATGLVPGSATLAGTLNDAENSGSIRVGFDYHGAQWVATFDQITETKPFMDGGVRFGFDEHGDTQVGDTTLPTVRAKAAAWGFAKVTKNGEPVTGKAGELWTAHLMVLDDTVRGADGKILNAAGNAPYDPAKPTDAKVTRSDPQAFFFVKSPDGETAVRADVNGTKTLAFAGPEAKQSVDIPTEKGAGSLVVNITITGAAGPAPGLGTAKVTLRDAGGNASKTADLTLTPNNPSTASFTLAEKEITGPFKLEVDGAGAFSAKVDYVATFDDHPFIVVTWDDVTAS